MGLTGRSVGEPQIYLLSSIGSRPNRSVLKLWGGGGGGGGFCCKVVSRAESRSRVECADYDLKMFFLEHVLSRVLPAHLLQIWPHFSSRSLRAQNGNFGSSFLFFFP